MTRPPAPAPWPVTITPLLGMPEVRPGDDLAALVLAALTRNWLELRDGDVLVVSSKVASKALGLTAPAADREAAVRSQARRVVAERDTPLGVTRVVEAVAGPVMAAAGVDASNTGAQDVVLLLPDDPDAVARGLRASILTRAPGLALGVVLSDTAGRAWRVGQTDFDEADAGGPHRMVVEIALAAGNDDLVPCPGDFGQAGHQPEIEAGDAGGSRKQQAGGGTGGDVAGLGAGDIGDHLRGMRLELRHIDTVQRGFGHGGDDFEAHDATGQARRRPLGIDHGADAALSIEVSRRHRRLVQ